MATFDPYSVACNPDTYTVLGLRLRHLSLGKILIFQRLDLPYFNDKQAPVTMDDLIIATFICSLTYEQFFNLTKEAPYEWYSWENIKSFGYARYYTKKNSVLSYQVRQWSKAVSKAVKKSKDFDLHYEISKFNSYMATIQNEPEILMNDSDSKAPSESPWVLSLLNILMKQYSFEDAVEMPVAKAFWEFYKYAEEQGNVEFFNSKKLEAQGLI